MVAGIKKLFIYSVGHTYSNLSRLFLRLFAGIMFMQFGIRQWMYFDCMVSRMPAILGMTHEVSLIILIVVEMLCSILIILGLFSRVALIPPILSMALVEWHLFNTMVSVAPEALYSTQPVYIPMLFIGIFVYMFLAGPGKISLDYLISLKFVDSNDRQIEETLKDA